MQIRFKKFRDQGRNFSRLITSEPSKVGTYVPYAPFSTKNTGTGKLIPVLGVQEKRSVLARAGGPDTAVPSAAVGGGRCHGASCHHAHPLGPGPRS